MSKHDILLQLVDEFAADQFPMVSHFLCSPDDLVPLGEAFRELEGTDLKDIPCSQEVPTSEGDGISIEGPLNASRQTVFSPFGRIDEDDPPENLRISREILRALGPDSSFEDEGQVDGALFRQIWAFYKSAIPEIVDELSQTPIDHDQFLEWFNSKDACSAEISRRLLMDFRNRNAAEAIVAFLRTPVTSYNFMVPIGLPSPLAFNYGMGGAFRPASAM